jgi:hypothetical protein
MRRLTIIGSIKDRTTAYVAHGLTARGIDFDYLDIARIIASGTWECSLERFSATASGVDIELVCGDAAYYRYVPLDRGGMSAAQATRFRNFTADLHGFLRSGEIIATTVPGNAFHNFSKPLHQIVIAQMATGTGIKFPDFILSNLPSRLVTFAERHNFDLIAKGASGAKTWALGLDEPTFRERLAFQTECPTFLQRRVYGWDCRVHNVAGRCFGEAIRSEHADYRRRKNVQFVQIELPTYISEFCNVISRGCGALLAGIDFKVDNDGTWHFLELNSMPCFQGYDRRAGGKILDALADTLLRSS